MAEKTGINPPVFDISRYQSGIDHSLINLESGMVNWYLEIPLFDFRLAGSADLALGGLTGPGQRHRQLFSQWLRALKRTRPTKHVS